VPYRQKEAQHYTDVLHEENDMVIGTAVAPIVALIAGILILIIPRLLNYIVALYLILIGVIGLVPSIARLTT
jgi:DUF3096 family protein